METKNNFYSNNTAANSPMGAMLAVVTEKKLQRVKNGYFF